MAEARRLLRSSPESQGVSAGAITAFLEGIEQSGQELHSLMVLRKGAVVAEGAWAPYTLERQHMLFSLTKCFTSTAVGLAVASGLLSTEDKVTSFFPSELTGTAGPHLREMKVEHLLTMSTGHATDPMELMYADPDGDWVKAFFLAEPDEVPGTHFVYSSGASHILAVIVQQVTGQSLIDYLKPRLFEPLGIEDPHWDTCPLGKNTGGFGLNLRTEDIAKFGQLYLQKGKWDGQQLIPASWISEATSLQIENPGSWGMDWSQGYGYQFWMSRHGGYRGDGAFGQYCIVLPRHKAVIVMTGGHEDMQQVLNLVWEHLLPGFALPAEAGRRSLTETVDSGKALAVLQKKLKTLSLSSPKVRAVPYQALNRSGQRYKLTDNSYHIDVVEFEFAGAFSALGMHLDGTQNTLICGSGEWIENRVTIEGSDHLISASGYWESEDTFVMIWRWLQMPFCDTFTFRFGDERLTIDSVRNVNEGLGQVPKVIGVLYTDH
ncbi:serine hydrolase domain-containing protein [Paenibacillus sp. SN-8-1]|uniref:serine hydrolase domain-containing protein n=1 Tax=Paenibacillus sp. SN-8-1 TaxID=3435409 RepID=UPI003D9A4BF7